ncbi:hypothetical protein P691DRAFT_765880 [Macrolepiota fuliginosa MF-IS2]|uniref:Uncharacterized protein n=1 Tax=Macrolepiota fuliginosa MF-IS2 TaxID=1400762 RepID=A0A9P5X2Q1_9AGAR|nr:hypothetical protein P691DRAFT_765880 [Macrolepiota fuliginosa MF-IS2]
MYQDSSSDAAASADPFIIGSQGNTNPTAWSFMFGHGLAPDVAFNSLKLTNISEERSPSHSCGVSPKQEEIEPNLDITGQSHGGCTEDFDIADTSDINMLRYDAQDYENCIAIGGGVLVPQGFVDASESDLSEALTESNHPEDGVWTPTYCTRVFLLSCRFAVHVGFLLLRAALSLGVLFTFPDWVVLWLTQSIAVKPVQGLRLSVVIWL